MTRIVITAAIGAALLISGGLWLLQRRLIYLPRAYAVAPGMMLPKGGVELAFTTRNGRQVAYYIPPRDGATSAPARLWACFGGNGSLALDWLDLAGASRDRGAGFLLVEYPGYGRCEGKPSRNGIAENGNGALAALAKHLAVSVAELEKGMGILGHSIGAAAGLDFSRAHRPKAVVLVSPFTTLLAMARRVVGGPLSHLLADRFDNPARLRELAALPRPPAVHIFHGTKDDVVPFSMGRELADAFPKMVTFHPVDGADHNLILVTAEGEILKAMSAGRPGQ